MKKNLFIYIFILLGCTLFGQNSAKESTNKYVKPFMGVTLGTSWGDGVELESVSRNYGAERAGLKSGDIITAINSDVIKNGSDFTSTLRKYRPSEEVEVTYLRGKEKNKVKVKLAENPSGSSWSIDSEDMEDAKESIDDVLEAVRKNANEIRREVKDNFRMTEKARLGIYPQTDWKSKAVKITGFTSNSPTEKAGLRKGDLITKINNQEINTEDALRHTLKEHRPGEEVTVNYLRDGKKMDAKVVLTSEKVFETEDKTVYVDKDSWGSSYSKSEENNETRTWSSYTFADGTQVDLNNFVISPTQNNLNISFDSKLNQPFSVVIYDDNGKEIVRHEQAQLDGKFEKQFDITNTKSNTLFVKLWLSGKEAFSQKVNTPNK